MAKGSGSGDLLNDLLKEARKGVEQEAKQLATETARRDQVERDAREREETRKREEAQQRLIEENRRRNEALARRDREGERKTSSTAKHARAEPVVAVVAPAAAVVKSRKPPSKIILAGLVAGGLAIGVGTGFALQPESKGSFPDLELAARSVVTQTSRAASVEKQLKGELTKLQTDLSGLQKQVGGAGTDIQKLRSELASMKTDLTKAQNELALERAAAGSGVKTTPHTTTTETGLPSLGDCTFKDCKKKPN